MKLARAIRSLFGKNGLRGLVVVLVLAKGTLWIAAMPPLQTPDEASHFAYVQTLSEEGRIPVASGKPWDGSSEELLDLAKRVQAHEIAFHPEITIRPPTSQASTTASRASRGSTSASGYPPLYYAMASVAYRLFYDSDILARLYAVRFLSLLISLLAAFAAYSTGRLLFPRSPTFAFALTLVVSLHPMFSMMAAAANNDVLVDSLSALLFFWCLRLVLSDAEISKPIRTGLTGGLVLTCGLLTKPQMLYTGAIVTLALVISFLRTRQRSFRTALAAYAITSATLFAPWAVFSIHHYGSAFGSMGGQLTGSHSGTTAEFLRVAFASQRLRELWHESLWARFGWLDTSFPPYVYNVLAVGLLLAVAGLPRSLLDPAVPTSTKRAVIASAVFLIGNLTFLHAIEFSFFRRFHFLMLQGRYLLTSLLPIAVLLLLGARGLASERFRPKVDVGVALGALVLHIASILLIMKRYWGLSIA